MKTAMDIEQLAKEIKRQEEAKKDYVGSTAAIELKPDLTLNLGNGTDFGVTTHCHGQIAGHLDIPKRYYDKMLSSSPELLTDNVNHWLKKNPTKRMVRTLDGNARAFVSDKYRPLDNYDLFNAALPIFWENEVSIKSCDVTDRKLYVKTLFPKLEAEVKKGDVVQGGICLSNSEIGAGSLAVEIFIYRLVCQNGMISQQSMRKHHVGRSQVSEIQRLLTERTKNVKDAGFWLEVQDVIRGSFDEANFLREVDKLKEATERKIESNDFPAVVEVVKKQSRLSDTQGNDILRHLCEGGDFTQYGLAQAITRTAEDQDSYDGATDLEKLGGAMIEMAPKDWKAIATVAA